MLDDLGAPSPPATALALQIVAGEVIVRGVEEPVLAQAHGNDFLRYKRRTGRFLPRLRAVSITPR